MADKRTALRDLLQELATAQGQPFAKTTFRPRDLMLGASSPMDRKAVLGDPTSYLRLSHIGGGESIPGSQADVGNWTNQQTSVPHDFRVVVMLHYDDADTYAESSQADFDRLIESEDEPIGLLPHLRRESALIIQSETCALSRPQDVTVPTVPRPIEHQGGRLYAHYMDFTITITSSVI